jgi:predicted nucleic acid-binding protein
MCTTWCYVSNMPKMIQLRHVPDELHRKLKARAALEGLSVGLPSSRGAPRCGAPHIGGAASPPRPAPCCHPARPPSQSREGRAGASLTLCSSWTRRPSSRFCSTRRKVIRVAARLFRPGETLHAPHLIDLEVAQVLRRYALAGDVDAGRGREALEDLADLPISRYPHGLFVSRIWELRRNVTAYDAAYVALAEALAAPLVTRDAALASVRTHRARVELL